MAADRGSPPPYANAYSSTPRPPPPSGYYQTPQRPPMSSYAPAPPVFQQQTSNVRHWLAVAGRAIVVGLITSTLKQPYQTSLLLRSTTIATKWHMRSWLVRFALVLQENSKKKVCWAKLS